MSAIIGLLADTGDGTTSIPFGSLIVIFVAVWLFNGATSSKG